VVCDERLGDGAAGDQGLTLVQCSAQLKPFRSHLPVSHSLIDRGEIMRLGMPQNVLTLSRKVDECKPLPGTMFIMGVSTSVKSWSSR